MAALEVLALDPVTPQIRAPGAGDTYTFPRSVAIPGNGSAAAPLLQFGPSGNMVQFYAPFNQTWQVALGGADAFYFDSSQFYPSVAGAVNLGKSNLGWKQLFIDQTVTAGGTTGARTINKAAGTVNFAAAASSLVVTNSLVTSNSEVYAVVRTNDTTAVIKNVIPTAGSFTINLNAAATAETSVGFIVINA